MIDKYGLVVQEDGDGGDCPCRTGVVMGADVLQNNPSADSITLVAAASAYLQASPDVYIRYPTAPMDQPYDADWGFSRDQASRLMLGLGIAGQKELVKNYYLKVVKNWLRHQNGDFIGTGEPGNLIRTLNLWPLYPLLWVFDLKFLVDIIAYKWQSWDYDNLFIMDLYYAKTHMATPWSALARVLYDKEAAKARVTANLLAPNVNGCKEAGEANIWMLENL